MSIKGTIIKEIYMEVNRKIFIFFIIKIHMHAVTPGARTKVHSPLGSYIVIQYNPVFIVSLYINV